MKNESFLNFLKTMQQKSAITEIKTGDAFNYDTPTSFLLQKHYGKSINSYIYHKELFIFPLNQLVYVYILKDDILVTKAFSEKEIPVANPILFRIEYKVIYSVIPEISDKKVLLHINKTKNETFSEFDTITLVFKVQRDLIIFKHFIEKQTRLQWQKFFEGFIPISPPYLYQIHFFIKKVNSRGKRQNRVLVFSNKVTNFYNYYHCLVSFQY